MTARARATRFFMPPLRLTGIFFCWPPRSTTSSASCTRRAICAGSRSPLSRRGNATFSSTLIESNSAPCWNRMPTLRRIGPSCRSRSPPMLRPSTRISPGVRVQQADDVLEQHAFSTAAAPDDDHRLPGGDIQADPTEHVLVPKRFVTPRISRKGDRLRCPVCPSVSARLSGCFAVGHQLPTGKIMFSSSVRKKFDTRMANELMTTASVVARPTPTAPSRAPSPS